MQSSLNTTHTTELADLARFVEQHPRLFVLTGAGCSTASGIPDYRNADGQWKQRQPVQYQEFVHHERARQRYWARSMIGWPRFSQARPNPAHQALARLEKTGRIHQLVTQNVDGLHQQAGSRRVIDLHGRLDTVECLSCGYRLLRQNMQQRLEQYNPEFHGLTAGSAADGDAMLEGVAFERFQVPACPRCTGLLKPCVVFFGESVPRPRVDFAVQRLQKADALLVIGSSLMVFSGYRFCRKASEQDKPIAAVNLGRTRADAEMTLKITGPCGAVLTELVERLGI